MPRRAWLPIAALSVLVVASAAGIVVSERDVGTQTLVVEDATDGTELLAVAVEPGSEVAIEYTHSVERTPVVDVYTVDDGELVMTRSEFQSFGAGLPSRADVALEDGVFVYEPPPKRYAQLTVATGHIADHDLVVDGERYDLAALADGESITLDLEHRLFHGL
ncbi:TRAP-type transport system protein small subunit [Natronomonas pharaonis DSM 2160]|uniref:TRAP-type transport system protein small subunit n=1 Tax=Natronomonas pharaonis (strain ATCC 35678 / DSM 2160 / CIP 103997 / JCM 8858 / NBRC 14720 / NCIMB 2260 / Gabara) TaxID=348780 RepID=A0A1U7ETV2_NATPD|nr:DUF1850 domain-containing protein [Natronomonas pharaonis]CAI48362.1 TRAP-type transport system protein small subunit [Natronomonas pharaonis DSM 2160]